MFTLHVALELAKSNHKRAKKPQEPFALHVLANCHLRIGERSVKEGHLHVARNAAGGAPAKSSKTKERLNWALLQWNRGDLALARFEPTGDPTYLSSARTHVNRAREVFAEGSEHQTQRCDDLLAKFDAAEGK